MSAAAGKPYKKRSSTKKSTKTVKAMVRPKSVKVLGVSPGRDPFAAATPRFFKVNLEDSMIYCNGAGTVSQFSSALAPVPWMNLGAAFADSTGAAGALQFGFTTRAVMTDINNYLEFTDLFQQFALLKMECKVSTTCGDSYGGVILPTVYSALDDNDSQIFSSQSEVNAYGATVREHCLSASTPFTRSCLPKPAAAYFISALATGYAVPQTPGPTWIDTNSAGTAHYAMKFYVRNFINAPNSGMAIRVQPTLWFACRNPH